MPKNDVVKGAEFRVLEEIRGGRSVRDRRLEVQGIEAREGGRFRGVLYAKCLSRVVGTSKPPVLVWVEVARLEKTNLFEKIDKPKLETSCAPCESCSRPQKQEWRPGASPCGEAA